ncbi:hypothetical protein SNE40_011027 [Patella caerulea]|uniref:Fibrous sheath-interacting protein 1 n=1 Tax=Patella caerulea TaxID=87958 RepID=A0AAN8JRH7_PATCE
MTKNINKPNKPTSVQENISSTTDNQDIPELDTYIMEEDNNIPTTFQSEELGLDLDFVNSDEFYVSSEGEYEWESEDEDTSLPVIHGGLKHKDIKTVTGDNNISLTASKGALVPLDIEDDDDIGSDEERDLLRGIKDEIEQKVRQEMKSELEMYKEKLKAIENGRIDDGDDDKKNNGDEDLENMDPKIKEALIKMRKLDRILNKKLKREKEVKKERILLERRMRDEIAGLKTVGREHRESKTNTDKYLALTLPPSHNEGVMLDSPSVTPVFQTQVDETDFNGGGGKNKQGTKSTGDTDHQGNAMTDENGRPLNSATEGKKKRKNKKDFIKRNKELASQAEESIAMTDEEKKRVSGLLDDLESLPDVPDDISMFMAEENPFQIAVRPGEGFLPDNIELRSLANIDSQLKHIMPSDDYESLMSFPNNNSSQHKLFTRVGVKSVLDFEKYGDRALVETKEQREMKEKLKKIEEELASFSNPREMQFETPSLSGDQLNNLLEDCARSMSRTSCMTENDSLPETTPRSVQSSSRSSLYDNPPVLPHDVLQKLLAEAYCPISSKLSSVEEEIDEEEEMEPISAETWRVVAEQKIDDEEIKNINVTHKHSASDSRLRNSRSRQSSFEEYNQNIFSSQSETSKPEYDKRPFLPEISKSPFLISQGLNNEIVRPTSSGRRGSSGDPGSIQIIRNSLQDNNNSSMTIESFSDCNSEIGETTPIPRPPSCDKRPSSNQSSRSVRTLTPSSSES